MRARGPLRFLRSLRGLVLADLRAALKLKPGQSAVLDTLKELGITP